VQVNGLGPDAQLAGAVGVGFGGHLRNPFLGRARVGALYVFEPFIANAGISFEVGALGKLAIGCELELNAWRGLFAEVGFARVDPTEWMTHAVLGFTVLGIEWQHRWSQASPSDALLLEVRLPFGIWWRMVGRTNEAPSSAASPASDPRVLRPAPAPLVVQRPLPPRAAGGQLAAADSGADNATGANSIDAPAHAETRTDAAAAERVEVAEALAEADRASLQSDYTAVASALQRAYMLHPDPLLLPRLAQAQAARGRLVLAARDLRRFMASTAGALASQRASAQAQLDSVEHRLAHLRVELVGVAGGEELQVDGVPEPTATLGYDVAIDPGTHDLVLSRKGHALARRTFSAKEAELVRLALDAALPAVAQPAAPSP
jgi:hypothetical protein